MMIRTRKAAITGMGCLSAAGGTLGDNLASFFISRRNAKPPTRFSTDHAHPFPVFEVLNDLSPPDTQHASLLSRSCLLLLTAAREAISQAGLDSKDLSSNRVGVCIGTSVGSSLNSIGFYDDYRSSRSPGLEPVHRYLASNPAACLAKEYSTNGPIQTIVNTCSSGTDALGVAASWIARDLCDIVLAGGTDELSKFAYNGFSSLRILDTQPSRPFDETRSGLNLGEGAGLMVLESPSLAKSRGHKVLGGILGYGTSCDGHHLIAPHPDGLGLRKAIAQALTFSQIDKDEITFINAHGTGTRDNDRVESTVMSDMLPGIPFFSTKGCTGHTLGAAGAIEAVYTLACLNEQRIPPSAGFSVPSKDTPSSPVTEAMALNGEIAVSQSLAFGGNNAVLVFDRGDQ